MAPEDDLTALAVEIAREAGELARRRRTEGVAIAATKSNVADIVTDADREVEALVRARLAVERPRDGFLGEESGAERGDSGVTWVVDPIDEPSTTPTHPAYAVSIAAVQGEPAPDAWTALTGVVYNPASDELFSATRGNGARLNGAPISVNPGAGAAGAARDRIRIRSRHPRRRPRASHPR